MRGVAGMRHRDARDTCVRCRLLLETGVCGIGIPNAPELDAECGEMDGTRHRIVGN